MVWYWRSTSLPNWCAIFGAAVGAGAALATGTAVAGANKSSVVPLLACCSASANQRLKPNSVKRVTKSAHAGDFGLKSAIWLGNSWLKSMSVLMVMSCLDSGKWSNAACKCSPTLPLMSPALAMTLSKLSYCSSHFTAVFGPTLSTPGTLSTLSPIRVK